jgi:glycosyltransferase involved in cell wall biosynthesis
MKILWISNAPWYPSGYGSQTRQVGSRIAKAGYEIEFVANTGTFGDREWEGLLVRGSGADRYSRDSVREDLERSKADVVVSLYDAWVYTEQGHDPFEGLTNVWGWVPVDHYPTPLALYAWLEHHNAIAMSNFGYRCLSDTSRGFEKAGARAFPVVYAPHAVDDVFAPTDRGFRQMIDVPAAAYLVGIVAANNGTSVYDRKGFSDMSAALARFMDAHPDVYLYVHTLMTTHDGIDLVRRFDFTGIPRDRTRWADQYALKKMAVSDEQMARIYSSFDVLLGTSRGEGFGLPGIEAQACGTPVILSNWTAQAELVGEAWSPTDIGTQRHPSGWLVGVDPDWDPRQGADFAKPHIAAIIGCLKEAYERRGNADLRDAAIAKAATYRADVVFDNYWRPLLRSMAQDVALSPAAREVMSRQARRLAKRKAKVA